MPHKQRVKEWMTKKLITITPQTTLTEANILVEKNPIRRLPVIDGDKLVGIVSWGDLREARPSDATTVSHFEIYHILSRMTVERIMSKNVVTIGTEDSMGLAAKKMHDNRIACLPVMEKDKLAGIITVSDVLRMMISITKEEA